MTKVLLNFLLLASIVLNISMPYRCTSFTFLDHPEVIKLEDFPETDGDPANNDAADNVEADSYFIFFDLGWEIELAKIFHTKPLPIFIDSYYLKLFIPPSPHASLS